MTAAARIVAVLEGGSDERLLAAAAALGRLLGAETIGLRLDEDACPGAGAAGAGRSEQVLDALAGDGVVGGALSSGGDRPLFWEVITRTQVPVLVVPPGASRTLRPIRRVVLPLDGSSWTASVVEELAQAAVAAGVDVVPVHVFAPATTPAFWDQAAYSHRTWTAEFLRRHRLGDAPLDLRRGTPAAEVLQTVERSGADLVLLGWSQDLRPGHAPVVRRLLEGSVPVLLVGSGPGTFDERQRGPSSLAPGEGPGEGGA